MINEIGIGPVPTKRDLETANQLKSLFLECIVAPHFEENAKTVLADKKNLRVIELNKLFIENLIEII